MLIYLTVIFIIYFGFLLVCMAGWQKFVKGKTRTSHRSQEFVSVVVAVRNEEGSISRLLTSLEVQDFARSNFEVIFVNDHSTDASAERIERWIKSNQQLQVRLLQSPGEGKKHALTEGIQRAKGEIILTTDADCVLPPDWISTMVLSFNVDSDKATQETTMVVGSVKIQQDKSLFSKLQTLEFSSVMGTGVALLEVGFPVMCNGASLAFRKKSFVAVNGYEGNLHIPSGDDEFLMRKLNEQFPGSIKSIRSASVVSTQPQTSLKKFIHQRLRWASKWKANDSWIAKSLALFIFIFQASGIMAMCLLFSKNYGMVVGGLLVGKFLLEGYLLFTVGKRLGHTFSIPSFLILQLVYPFYVISVGIFSQLFEYEWKGREGIF